MKHFSTSFPQLGTLLVTLFFLLAAGPPVRAQQTEASQQATQLALQTRSQWAGSDLSAADFRLSNARIEPSGLLYAYPQQLQAGIPVYNQVVTLVFKDGKLRHHAGAFLPVKVFAGQPATPRVTAAAAVATALASTSVKSTERPVATSAAGGPEQQQTFAPAGVAHRPIVVRLVWATDKGTPRLAWNVNVDLLATPDWLNIRVDAATGQVLGQDNWTVHEKAAYPAATPGRRAMAAATPQARRQPGSVKSTQAVTPASYRVVPFPNERPDVTTPTIDTNPWLRAGASNPVASYGWHFDGTTNYTDTRGNNVWAYDDSLKLDAPGRFTASTGTSSSLVFNDVPDFTKTPTLGRNRRAATTNLFYWNNLMHDVMYQYGFTEATGNFQTDNQGRGGTGNDHVRAEAQDGGGTNNANFATPPDGLNGRMQMYLFTGITPTYTINVTAPATVAGNYVAVEGTFSTNNKLATLGPISGQLALYADAGSNPTTYLACGAYGGTTPLTGKVALLYRGTCNFSDKTKNAQLAGAVAVIVINNAPGAPTVMGGADNTVTIPSVMISQADGATLVAQIANGIQVTLPKPAATGPQLDGDYDSGVMSHEYGHGISNRLTGGGTNTSCLYNAEQAGEGWSDYFALMMTTDWTTTQTTDGAKARPVGTYVNGQTPTASGIRRYPYSTSLTVNPLTYANMATSTEVHNIGEIWCATLWDMTWNIIQMQGTIEPNLYNGAGTGGNAVALQLVMQGLKLQPCQPGFLDGRDAILAADSLLYNGQYHCAIWGAFARRGMGFSAREGSSNSAIDQTVAFDLPGVSLRKNTVPVAGNQFTINIAATCECQTPAPVSITDQLPTGLQYLNSTGGTLNGSNNTVTFANLSFTQGQRRTFQILAQTAPGAGCTIALPVNDDRDANTVGGFTPAVVTGTRAAWAPTTTRAHSGTTVWATGDPSATANVTLTSGAFTPTGFSVLSFYHYFNTESTYDGGIVAISVNNGTWQNAAAFFLQNGYNSVFATGTASVGQGCFSGVSSTLSGPAAFQQSMLNLSSFAGQSIRVRFQFQSDVNNDYGLALPGWFIDDIQVQNGCGGLQQVQLLTSTNTVASSYAQPTFLTEPNTLWTGTVSTDWFTAGNWTAGVPTSTLDAVIPAGAPRYPLLNNGAAFARSLTLDAGASLTQTNGTLDVRGNWINNGTFTASGGTVSLGQSTLGTILGSGNSRFWNLATQTNGLALNTAASTSVQRVLTLTGNLTSNANPLTLLSGSTGDALVVNSGGVVTGTATVQRYIDPSLNPGLGYRHYSAPVSNTTVADLATAGFAPVVNPAYNSVAAPATLTPFPTVYGYNDSRLSLTNTMSSFDKGFVSPAALTDALTVGRGYTVNIAANQLVDFQGTLTTGDRSLALTSSRPTYPDGGWQLLGNPYPAPLDYSLVTDRTGLEDAVYVYSSASQYAGQYRSYVNNVGNPIIPMGQAFFVRAAAGLNTATLNFHNTQRLTAPNNTSFQRRAETRPLVQLTLQGAGSPLLDEATVYFENGATAGFEPAFDAEKLTNPTGLNLSTSLAGGRQLSIDGQSELSISQRVVPLTVGVPTPGRYTFTASQLLNLNTVPVYLRDLQLGTLTDLRQQPTYQFAVSNASALLTGRFELVFSPQQVLATVPAALAQQVAVYPNPARTQVAIDLPLSLSRQPVTAVLIDALGRIVRQQVLPAGLTTHTLSLTNVTTGVYSLRLTTEQGTITKKLVVE